HLRGRMSDYALIVLPETDRLEPDFKQRLLQYVRNGGSLLLIGPRPVKAFGRELEVSLDDAHASAPFWLEWNGALTPVSGIPVNVPHCPNGQPYGKLHVANEITSPHIPAGCIWRLGRGKIGATWFDFSRNYLESGSTTARQFLAGMTRELFPEPLIEVEGSHAVDVVIAKLDGRVTVNLVNTSGPHATEPVFDAVPPLGELVISVRYKHRPERVTLEPGGKQLSFEHRDGIVRVTLPQLDLHNVLVIHP
ncbi:MAG: hypothetical protein N3G20_08755, partial [Verrucomicrobiae bacterium]|nr:hypothetical protein [Verrucomicrobiae bacterium]